MKYEKEVFISYKSEEFDKANWVKTILENNGITCWMAPEDIKGGSSYAIEIPKAIRQCKIFVLILSEKAQNSKWVPKELDQAINEGKIIMPFMLDDCLLKDDFNFYLTNVQRYEAYKNKAAAIERMLTEINMILGKDSLIDKEDKRISIEDLEDLEEDRKGKNCLEEKNEPLKKGLSKKSSAKKSLPKKSLSKKSSAKKNASKAKRKVRWIFFGIVVVLVMLGIGNKISKKINEISIAGQTVEKDRKGLALKDVDLSEEDIYNLEKMEQLNIICFENCTFSEALISVINNRNLNELTLKNCGITNEFLEKIAFSEMDNLTVLNLEDNPKLSDLSCITTVTDRLYTIRINNTSVKNLDFMKEAEKCYYLEAANNGIEDISILENCTNLKELNLDGNNLTSLEGLRNCKKLYKLSVNGNQLTELRGLESCIEMEWLYAGDNELTSLTGMENMTRLNVVYLNNNHLSDLSILSKSAETLSKLYVNNNQLKDMTALENCVNLEYLTADKNQITTLSCLTNCIAIKQLTAENNQLTSLEGLQNCSNLSYLDVSDNQLVNTEALESASLATEYNLQIDLSNNQISNLKLGKEKYCIYLDLRGNPIQNLDVLLENKVKNVAFDYRDISSLESLKESDSILWIVNCPLDQQIKVKELFSNASVFFDDLSEFENIKQLAINNVSISE